MAYYNNSNDINFYPTTGGFEEHPFLSDASAIDLFRGQDHESIGDRWDMPLQQGSSSVFPSSLAEEANLGKHNHKNFIG